MSAGVTFDLCLSPRTRDHSKPPEPPKTQIQTAADRWLAYEDRRAVRKKQQEAAEWEQQQRWKRERLEAEERAKRKAEFLAHEFALDLMFASENATSDERRIVANYIADHLGMDASVDAFHAALMQLRNGGL